MGQVGYINMGQLDHMLLTSLPVFHAKYFINYLINYLNNNNLIY